MNPASFSNVTGFDSVRRQREEPARRGPGASQLRQSTLSVNTPALPTAESLAIANAQAARAALPLQARVQEWLGDQPDDEFIPANDDDEVLPDAPCEPQDAAELLQRLNRRDSEESQTLRAPTIAPSEHSTTTLPDPTTLHEHEARDIDPEDTFKFAFALWMSRARLSRARYAQLLEVLELVGDLRQIATLPKRPDTLATWLSSHLPLAHTRTMEIELEADVLPTGAKTSDNLTVFDMADTYKTLLASDQIREKIFTGLGRLSDTPKELWESRSWGSSLRTTSGQYLSCLDGTTIFPSDFVRWRCEGSCTCDVHVGRVVYCGIDCREQSTNTVTFEQRIAIIQPVYCCLTLDETIMATIRDLSVDPPATPDPFSEVFLMEDVEVTVLEKNITSHETDVFLDYGYKDEQHTIPPNTYYCRYVCSRQHKSSRALQLSNPHRGELELDAFGRQHFLSNFAKKQVISLPFMIYWDDFGVHSNMYRSMAGLYSYPCYLRKEDRERPSALLPLTYGPFGAARADIARGLTHLQDLDRGLLMKVDGHDTLVVAFPMCFVGDMMMVQELAGCLGHQATYPCRMCVVTNEKRADLSFDIVKFGRYYHHMRQQRLKAKASQYKTVRAGILTSIGLDHDQSLFEAIYSILPALDPKMATPVDAAHSEMSGITHRVMKMLMVSILLPKARKELTDRLRRFKFPPGWAKIQSPLRHLDSWNMQEHGRAAILFPVFLNQWLSRAHVNPHFLEAIDNNAPDYLRDTAGLKPVELLIAAMWQFSLSIICMFTNNPEASGSQFEDTVMDGRRAVACMMQSCADAVTGEKAARRTKKAEKEAQKTANSSNLRRQVGRRRQGSVASAASVSSQSGSESQGGGSVASQATSESTADTVGTKSTTAYSGSDSAATYLRWKGLPNMHTGIHIPQCVKEYGSMNLISTFPGESKHR